MNEYRDLYCGEPQTANVGRRLKLAGWAARRRDHGGLVFIDLRDHTGICQLVVNPEHAPAAAEVAHAVRNEYVLQAEGELARARARRGQPESRYRGGGAPGRPARDPRPVASRSRSSSTRTASTRACGCGTATSTFGATRCRTTCGWPRR